MATKKSKKKRPLKNAKKAKPASKKKVTASKKKKTAAKKPSAKKSAKSPAKKASKAKKKTSAKKKVASKSSVRKATKAKPKKAAPKKKTQKVSASKAKAAKGKKPSSAPKKVTIQSRAKAPSTPKKRTEDSISWENVFSPLEDRILVEEVNTESESPSGLWIPQSPRDYREGVVRSVGPGAKDSAGRRRTMGLSVGDKVMMGKYAGQSLRLMDHSFLIVRESDLIGIVE